LRVLLQLGDTGGGVGVDDERLVHERGLETTAWKVANEEG
jgi:hypothetical protein